METIPLNLLLQARPSLAARAPVSGPVNLTPVGKDRALDSDDIAPTVDSAAARVDFDLAVLINDLG
jgi:hypothetical protein